jgi:hypothetical protein
MKKYHKKLVLNKKTVADLSGPEMNDARGGTLTTQTEPFTLCGFNCSIQLCTGITCGPCAYTVVGCDTNWDCPPSP